MSATPTQVSTAGSGLPGGGSPQPPASAGGSNGATASATGGGGGGGNTQAFCKDFITLYATDGPMNGPTMSQQLLDQAGRVDAEAPASVKADVDLWTDWVEHPSASTDQGISANEAYARIGRWLPSHCKGIVVN